jgi:hypothetical protein
MSKMDELRAMREQRFEQRSAAAAAARPAAPKAMERPAPTSPEAPDPVGGEPAVPGVQLCGHRSINGRTCTRDQGHAAKSHRYA